jgi:hypothetical protein
MTDESKIFWADELWAPPSALQSVEDGHIVGTYLSRRFIEGKYTIPLYTAPPAKQEQGEPVAWNLKDVTDAYKLGAKSQQRTWVGLTDEELEPLCKEWRILFGSWTQEFARAIEAKLRDKNK